MYIISAIGINFHFKLSTKLRYNSIFFKYTTLLIIRRWFMQTNKGHFGKANSNKCILGQEKSTFR